MEYQFLTIDIDSRGVAKVKLNRPEIHNAFNDQLIAELTHLFNALDADDSVRVAVLSGEGKSFCAGADLQWMRAMKDYSQEQNVEDSRKMAGMFHTLNHFSKPLIGVVHGAALGGGVGLVAVCDYVLATEDAVLGLTEARLGLVPAVISPFVIAKIGVSMARATFLSGARFTAKDAFGMKLVHELAEDARMLDSQAEAAVQEFLKAGPEAAKAAKQLIRDVDAIMKGAGEDERVAREGRVIEHTCKTIAHLRVQEEGQEGMSALLEKRKPGWQ